MRIARSVSIPLMPGSITSRMTRSMLSSPSSTESACSPLEAMTVSKPSRRRTASSTSRRTSSSSTIRIRISPSVLRQPSGARQRYRELRAASRHALHGDVTSRCVQDTPRDRQTESRAALPTLCGHERLEDPANDLRRDSLAIVLHSDIDALSVLLRADPDVATEGHRISSIEQDVGENLLQIVKVPADLRVGDTVYVDRDMFGFQKIFVQRDRRCNQRRHADRLARSRTIGDQVEQIV